MISDLRERLRALLLPRRWRRELDEEMQFHLEQEEAARVRAGASPGQARREARLAFGGAERYAEETSDATGIRPAADLGGDVGFALRALRRNPGYSGGVILVLGLALGAATAVFAMVHAVLLSQLPYPHAGRLVQVLEQNSPSNRWALSTVDAQAIQDQNRVFEAFGVARSGIAALTGLGPPEEVPVMRATSGVFQALGLRPVTGRLIEPADNRPGAAPVAVVTSAFAAQRLGGVEAAVGRSITLDGASHQVVGVLPPADDRLAGMPAAVWPSLQLSPPTRRGPFWLRGIGLLREGVTLEQAGRDLAGISRRIFPVWRAGFRDSVASLTPFPLRETIVGGAERELWLFAGAVLLLLLVALVNVATLTLVRTTARDHELAVRAALGASRARLARLVVVECLVLAAASAVLAGGIAAGLLRLIPLVAPGLPRSSEITLAGLPILVGVLLALAAGLLIGAPPAVSVFLGRFAPARAELRRAGGGRRGNLLRGSLVAAEFALAVPLLLTAALLGRSLVRLQRVDPGYDWRSTLSVSLSLPRERYDTPAAVSRFWSGAIQQSLETPGVAAAGLATASPPDNQGDANNFNLVAHLVPPGSPEPTSPWSAVTPGYFEALRIPLLQGRMFGPGDTGSVPPVAIVSRAWAAHYFPHEEVLGQELISGGCYQCPHTTIVGVVGDVKYQGLGGDGDGVYIPLEQSGATSATLYLRTRGAPAGFIRPLLDRLAPLDPALPLTAETMADRLRQVFADPGRWTTVVAAFAALALALAALGIAGLLSYIVRRQRREIGVRMALGAEPQEVIRMVVSRGMRYVIPGCLVGLGAALAGARGLASLLYGVGPRDPATATAVIAILLFTALAACLLPALRAARIRPTEAIAEE